MLTFNNSGPIGTTNACYGCKDRFVGCHATCPKYEAFKKELEEIKETQRHQATLDEYARRLAKPRGRK